MSLESSEMKLSWSCWRGSFARGATGEGSGVPDVDDDESGWLLDSMGGRPGVARCQVIEEPTNVGKACKFAS